MAVVKLFNAIAKQLKEQEKAADAPIHKQKKGAFRRVLNGGIVAGTDRVVLLGVWPRVSGACQSRR